MAGSIERMTGCCAKTTAAESFSVCFCLGPSPSSSPSLLDFPTRSSSARLQSTQYGQRCGHNAMAWVAQARSVGAYGLARTASMTSDMSVVNAAIRRKLAINAVQTHTAPPHTKSHKTVRNERATEPKQSSRCEFEPGCGAQQRYCTHQS